MAIINITYTLNNTSPRTVQWKTRLRSTEKVHDTLLKNVMHGKVGNVVVTSDPIERARVSGNITDANLHMEIFVQKI